jgi:hypothetical protein
MSLMPQTSAPRTRSARLQIRVSVDEHMGELYDWLLAMPATLRGRELVAQARVARALLSTAARAHLPADSGAAAAAAAAPAAESPQQLAASLGEQAAAQARTRLELGFLIAVPPLA